MNWSIKLLGGYTREDIKNIDDGYKIIIKDIKNKNHNKIQKYLKIIDDLDLKYKTQLDREKKKYNRQYQQNYRARKYLKTIKVNNNWKKHWEKIVEILDNN